MIPSYLIRKQRIIILILGVLIFITSIIAISVGPASVSINRLIPTILGDGTFKEDFVFFSIRLPRLIIIVLAGMALAISGSILQALTRNDLADPGIIGINSGAGAAVAAFFLFMPIEVERFVYMLPVVAFIGALVTAMLIYLFSYQRKTGAKSVHLVLVGIGFSMALSGLMVILTSGAKSEKVDFIANWLAGNIWGTDWPFIIALLPWILVLFPYTYMKSHQLNIFGMSEPVGIGLGMRVEKERVILLMVAVALAAATVSVTGGITFIGLMAPHIAKRLVGPRHQLFLPITILIGAWLLLVADTIGRNILQPEGIPTGIVVAIIGAPYFIYLLLRSK
ncbi:MULTISPECIES: iron ABC transporter permease [Clostridia]|uniref:FecCD family ABC transporter permease n=1 Tax=Clostridia TaxID=186801 RepID=UPI000EA10EB2|nr:MULTISPECIES: iron ABC transporter permease [Clostridia]NBJ71544.1 iron ABC transporter permease [Roseburia sp. 1XD42-34]RKI74213.1 iron ABC transporter permease [Clostridium sp. 1xD42-85]